MTRQGPKNIGASVRQRLQNLARQQRQDFQSVLSRYAIERLLYRISQTSHRDRFVLKGAILFPLWTNQIYRPTRDIDFLASGAPTIEHLESIFREVCAQTVDDDGMIYRPDSVRGSVIKPDQEYQGVRIQLEARLQRARIPVQIDIGFGDAVTPGPQQIAYPSLLGFTTPVISIYPRETVIAEKFQAMVMLAMANSRMKDFFDLWILATQFEYSGNDLARAIGATFERRRTPLPPTVPTALTDKFSHDDLKIKQWKAFTSKSGLASTPPFAELIADLRSFLWPPLDALQAGQPFEQKWLPPGPWRSASG